jgi:hypothetical protein
MGGGSSNDLMWSIAGVVIRDPRTPYAASMRALREFDAKLLKPRACLETRDGDALSIAVSPGKSPRFLRGPPPGPHVLRGPRMPELLRDEWLADILRATARRRPTHAALISESRTITYGELDSLKNVPRRSSVAVCRRTG